MNRPVSVRRVLPTAVALVVVLAACAPITPPAPTPSATPPVPPAALEQAPAPPAAAAVLANANVRLSHVVTLPNAIAMATRPNDDFLYFATQDGVVQRFRKGRLYPVLDIRPIVLCCGEQGLLGMTFNATGDKLYVHFSIEPFGATWVAEYPYTGGVINPASRRDVFSLSQPQPNHNGGSLLFSPVDGLLYLALGDGGGFNDQGTGHAPEGNGQSPSTLLGKLIRINPNDPTPGIIEPGFPAPGASYSIPPSNPYVGVGNRLDEIWSFGLRNPYRISFDRGAPGGANKGDLWIGDVGQGLREEIDHVAIDDLTYPGGEEANFGWNHRERDVDGPNAISLGPFVDPVSPLTSTLTHAAGECAVIGGYVYRGTRIPDLAGVYVFTDLCNPAIRAFTLDGSDQSTGLRNLFPNGGGVSSGVSFGEDNRGELYVLSLESGVWRIDNADPPFQRPWPYS